MKRMLIIFMILIIIAGFVFNNATNKDTIVIGVSFPDKRSIRWEIENYDIVNFAWDRGIKVISEFAADNDIDLQIRQIDEMIANGINVLIVRTVDEKGILPTIDKCEKMHIPVIAYDRLIQSPKISALISFNNEEIGEYQARGILSVKSKGRFILLGGSPTDYNSMLFRKGQMKVLQPLIDKGDITVVADKWVPHWDPEIAYSLIDDVLKELNNKVDAIIASNDGTAQGAIRALRHHGLLGLVAISGQDATAKACNSIVKEEQTMTVFKDIRLVSPIAVDMAEKFAKGKKVKGLKNYSLKELTLDNTLEGDIPCYFINLIPVDKDNIYDVIVKSDYLDYDDVYMNIPNNLRPPKP